MLYKKERNYNLWQSNVLRLLLLLLSFILAGCGNRGIPTIKQEFLINKISVLMLTGSSMSDTC